MKKINKNFLISVIDKLFYNTKIYKINTIGDSVHRIKFVMRDTLFDNIGTQNMIIYNTITQKGNE